MFAFFFFSMQNVLFDVLPFKLRMHILDAYYMSLFVLLLARVFFFVGKKRGYFNSEFTLLNIKLYSSQF